MSEYDPATDPKEAVRCGECAHMRPMRMADGTTRNVCTGAMAYVQPQRNTFCSWGRRKEGSE